MPGRVRRCGRGLRCRRGGLTAGRQDLRRGLGGRYRGEGRPGDGLIGAHRGGRLDPHAHVVGLVQRDRDGVDAEEIRRRQHPVHHVVGGQLRQRRHRGQRTGVGRGRGLVLRGSGRTVGAGLHQPGQIRGMGGDVLLGAADPARHRTARPPERRSVRRRRRRIRCSAPTTPPAAVSSDAGPGPLLSNVECTSGGNAIQIGAVTKRRRNRDVQSAVEEVTTELKTTPRRSRKTPSGYGVFAGPGPAGACQTFSRVGSASAESSARAQNTTAR